MFEKYDAYKDSGVDWLGQLPESWGLLPNKHIFKLKKNLVGKRSKEYELLSLTLNGVIKRDMENPEGKFPAEFDTYQEVKSGDFIFCHFDVEETPRTVGLSKFDGMITGAYTVYQANAEKFCPKFLYYFYLNLDTGKRLKPLYKGLRNTIGKDIFGEFKTFIPNYSEQVKISNFLDQKTSEIDQAIAIKEKQIALFNERKQIVIQKAVTQGLDLNVPMKDSGVEWIGQIPEHWNIHKLSYVAKLDSGSTPDRSNIRFWTNGTIPWLKTGEINYNLITQAEEFVTPLALSKSSLKLAPKGTVLMAMYGQGITRGRVAILDIDATYNQACCAIQCKKELFNKYLFQFFSFAYSFIRDGGNETSQMNISTGYISNLKVLVPPLNEQEQIVSYLDLELQKFSDLKALLKQEIEKLKEYKTTLINDAVTGKIKVA